MNKGFEGQDICIGKVVEQTNEDKTITRYQITKVFKKHFYGTNLEPVWTGAGEDKWEFTNTTITAIDKEEPMKGLPTTDPKTEGQLYVDKNEIKISEGENNKIIIVFLIGLAIATTLVLTFS